MLFILCIACNSKYSYNKITFSDDEIENLEKSMIFVQDILEKSDFDTLSIKKTLINNEIDNELLYNSLLNKDSISKKINENFEIDNFFPFSKKILYTNNGAYILNERLIGKNANKFRENILKCEELKKIKLSDKEKFIECFLLLNENHIWSCVENYYANDKNEYYFDYSKDNLYHSEREARYLYLENEVKNNPNLNNGHYKLLDEKKGLFLYKKRD